MVLSQNDYYPGGMLMPGRSFSSESYRFGFNSQEKIDEITGNGNHYTAQYWEYDPRTMIRWNLDPVVKPWESGYAVFAGNPILNADPLGDDIINKGVKRLCELAGWTKPLSKQRSVRGILKEISDKNYRFCDLVSSHTMRRTAITVLVCLGVPENLVRKISGHSPSSKEFYKYVDYAQHYKDKETDKAFDYFSSF